MKMQGPESWVGGGGGGGGSEKAFWQCAKRKVN